MVKSKMKLDCTSLESAQQSLCEIFNATEIELLALLRSVRPFESMDQRPEDVIYEISKRFSNTRRFDN